MLCEKFLLLFLCLSLSLSALATTKNDGKRLEEQPSSVSGLPEPGAMFSTESALSDELSLALFLDNARTDASSGRTLSQDGAISGDGGSDFECSLSQRAIRRYVDENTRTWRVTAAILDEIEHDLQSIINCTEDGDILLFDVVGTIRPAYRVTISNRLTLGANVENTPDTNDASIASQTSATFECPQDNEGIFTIQSRSIIAVTVECNGGQNGTLTFSNVQFASNRLVGAVAVDIPPSLSCMAVKMSNITFVDNTCHGRTCGADLSMSNELKDCTFKDNHLDDDVEDGRPFMLSVPAGSTTIARGITAEKNAVGLLKVEKSSLTLSASSTFTENRPPENRSFVPLIHLVDAEATFESCRFEENGRSSARPLILMTESSDVTLTDCHFIKNSAHSGGVLYLNASSVVIDECRFVSNAASLNGGVVYAFASNISTSNTVFSENKADNSGGCFYLESNSELNVSSDTRMTKNSAKSGGVAALLDRSAAYLANAVLEGSLRSAFNGSAFYLCHSRMVAQNCQFSGGVATRGGLVYANAADLEFTASNFSGGNASLGGAFALAEKTMLDMRDVRMEDNEAKQRGGAVYAIGNSNVTASHSQCISNEARGEGGGGCFFVESSSLTLLDTVLSENKAPNTNGGAVSCRESSTLSEKRSEFSKNEAAFGGTISLSSRSRADIESSNISDSRASHSGGVFFLDTAEVDLLNCKISVSRTEQQGGILYALASTVSVSHSQLKNGSAVDGGCLHLSDGTNVSIHDTSLTVCDAKGDGGAVWIADASECNISGGVLERNSANATGGAVYAAGCTLTIQDTNITDNEAREGGGVYASRRSELNLIRANLTRNKAKEGGALAIVGSHAATVTSCQFFQNSASDRGGGCYLYHAHTRFIDCGFRDNRGRRGGALGVWRYSEANLTDSVCRESVAEEDGGCLFGGHDSRVNIRNVSLVNCTAERNGGGIFLEQSTNLDIANSSFLENRAEQNGGAISARTSNVSGTGLVFRTNTARQSGGSVLCAEHCEMDIADAVFADNHAGDGGAGCLIDGSRIAIGGCQLSGNEAKRNGGSFYANEAMLYVSDSQFDRGLAGIDGGFVRLDNGSRIILQNVNTRKGEAKNSGGAMSIDDSEFGAADFRIEKCIARFDGGAMHMLNAQTSNCTRCQLTENRAERGGAVAVEHTESSSVEWCFVQSTLHDNTASYGGAIHLLEPQDGERQSVTDQGRPLFGLVRTELSRNVAEVGGNDILAFDLTGVRFICDDDASATTATSIPSRDELEKAHRLDAEGATCPEWRNGDGGDMTTYVRSVEKTLFFQQTNESVSVDGDRHTIRSHASGTPLPTIVFRSLTQLGQPSSLGLNRGVILAKTESGDFFSGNLQVDLHNGTGNFSSIVGFHNPGSYELRIAFSEDYLPDFVVTVEIRDCRIGESVTAGGSFCRPCSGATYSFLPDREDLGCLPCPENGRCNTSTIQPLPGYWHPWPCSSHLQKCLTEQACDFDHREERLYELTKDMDSCHMSDDLVVEYGDAQCHTGHTGPLCGSCKPDYGKAQFFTCKECFADGVNVLLYLLSIFVFLVLAAIAMKTNLEPNDQHPGSKVVVEIFKIAVDYAQVTAIAISINVSWSTTLSKFFEIAELISGVITEAIERAVHCLLHEDDADIERAVFAVVMDIVTVLGVLLLFCAFWGIVTVIRHEDWCYLWKKLGMSFFVVSYLSYIALTSTSIHILTCLEVHDSVEVANDSTTAYWVADTNIRCYEGSHAVLKHTLGWPLLVVFSFGFPVVVLCITVFADEQKRDQGNRKEILGFLYQSYRKRYCFWETIVLLRKAALAVVVMLAYPLGPNLQVMFSASVFTVALYLQTVCRPFGEDENGQNGQRDAADEQNDQQDAADGQNERRDAADEQNERRDAADEQNERRDAADGQNERRDAADGQNDQQDAVDGRNGQQDAAKELDRLNDLESISLLVSLLTFVSSLCFDAENVSSGVRLFVSLAILALNLVFFSYLVIVFLKKFCRCSRADPNN